ncbi:MAG: cyanophycinase, partial [Actinomycetales bacterium]|nr:cyanophycinase [Actinomycetales bacterium]
YDESTSSVKMFKKAGATNVHLLHTRDPKVADSDEFVAVLRDARALWFGGGRQWRLADAYLGTKTEAAFHDVLKRGGVIGGSSAGATIQASYLVRGAPEGNQIMMSSGHEQGFGFIHNSAIDQHLLVRKRENDMLPVIRKHPHLLGIGIDESTALYVRGNNAEVIGKSKVLFYDIAL